MSLQVRWHRSLEELPVDGPPTVYIANEFFDALPVHQLQRTERGWCVASPYRRWQLAVPAMPKHCHTISGACSRVVSGTHGKQQAPS